MKLLLYSLYSPPEKIGIGKYNGEMIDWFLERGHNIDLITTFPFYPEWEIPDRYKGEFYEEEKKGNLKIKRFWCYIPKVVNGVKRVLNEISFQLLTTPSIISSLAKNNYDAIIIIAPPFHLGIIPLLMKYFIDVKIIYHIQDLQVDAAKELELLPIFFLTILEKIEKLILSSVDKVTTISQGMINKLKDDKKIKREVNLFPNWTDTNFIRPTESSKYLHDYLGISHSKKLIVYSGNIGEKQGLEILFPVAKKMESIDDVHFVILGNGNYKNELYAEYNSQNISNLSFGNLVPKSDLNNMLNSSFIQLVIQKDAGADSYLPSKLTNILAVGCPAIVTAKKGTGLYDIVTENECALAVKPDSVGSIYEGLIKLLSNEDLREKLSGKARRYAVNNIGINSILEEFEDKILNDRDV